MFYDDIYHYGIPGQRHGRRRYQNPDGSLTPAGRARYLRGRTPSSSISSGRVAPATSISKDGKDSTNVDVWKTVSKRSPYVDRRTDKAKLDSGSASRVNRTMQQIKRPSDSNKNGTTSGSTKQNRGLSKNAQERTRYLTERAAAMNAIDLNAKYTRRLFAGLDTEDIKTNGTANNARNRYLDGLDALATRLGLTTDDLVISNFPSYEASYNSSSKRR